MEIVSDLWRRMLACLISWLGACLKVRCPVWRLQLTKSTTHARHTKEHSTRTPHKKRCMGIVHGRYHSSNRDGGAAAKRPPPHPYRCFHIIPPCIIPIHLFLCGVHVLCSFVWRALLSAASARPGSAPAGKPPAKRLGKQ